MNASVEHIPGIPLTSLIVPFPNELPAWPCQWGGLGACAVDAVPAVHIRFRQLDVFKIMAAC